MSWKHISSVTTHEIWNFIICLHWYLIQILIIDYYYFDQTQITISVLSDCGLYINYRSVWIGFNAGENGISAVGKS